MMIMDVRYHRSTMSAAGGRRGIATLTKGGRARTRLPTPVHMDVEGCVTHSQQHVVTAILVRACPSPGKQLHVSRGGGLMTCPNVRRRLQRRALGI